MFDAHYVDDLVCYPIAQHVGWGRNEFAEAVDGETPAIWEVGKTVAGIYQSLNEAISSLRIELTKISADRL